MRSITTKLVFFILSACFLGVVRGITIAHYKTGTCPTVENQLPSIESKFDFLVCSFVLLFLPFFFPLTLRLQTYQQGGSLCLDDPTFPFSAAYTFYYGPSAPSINISICTSGTNCAQCQPPRDSGTSLVVCISHFLCALSLCLSYQ